MSGTDMRQTIRAAADLLEKRLVRVPELNWELCPMPSGGPVVWGDTTDGQRWSMLSVNKSLPEAGAYVATMQPTVTKHLVTLLRTEAASTAGDEDHAPCTADKCATVAAYELALSIVG